MAALMNGAELDLLVTDPPYNVDYGGKAVFLENYLGQTGPRATSEIKNDKMTSADFYKFLRAAFRCAFDVISSMPRAPEPSSGRRLAIPASSWLSV